MQNETTDTSDTSQNGTQTLEAEIREAVANGVHVQETVQRLTLQALNAKQVDVDYLRRIVTAAMQGIHDGASQRVQQITGQSQAAKAQIGGAIAGLDAALAGFAQASKLAVEEAAGQAKKFSDSELTRTRSDLESLESLFLDSLQKTSSAAQGMVADILHDLTRHAKTNGTEVGAQLKETLAVLAQQIASAGHVQVATGISLAHATAEFVGKIASGVLSGINEQKKNN